MSAVIENGCFLRSTPTNRAFTILRPSLVESLALERAMENDVSITCN